MKWERIKEGRFASPLRWGRLRRLGKLAGTRKILFDREARTAVNIGKLTGARKILLDREARTAENKENAHGVFIFRGLAGASLGKLACARHQ